MRELMKEFAMPGLTWKQKAIVWYFVVSLCTLCVTDDSPIWAIVLIVLNFANAARLIKKIPLPDLDDYKNGSIRPEQTTNRLNSW